MEIEYNKSVWLWYVCTAVKISFFFEMDNFVGKFYFFIGNHKTELVEIHYSWDFWCPYALTKSIAFHRWWNQWKSIENSTLIWRIWCLKTDEILDVIFFWTIDASNRFLISSDIFAKLKTRNTWSFIQLWYHSYLLHHLFPLCSKLINNLPGIFLQFG